MADDPEVVGRWREGGSEGQPASRGPTSAFKWIGTAIVSILLAAAVGIIGWLVYQLGFATGPRPYFIAFWVGPYERPEIPPTAWLDADRRALLEDRVFPNSDWRSQAGEPPTLEVIQTRLTDLAGRRHDEAVVVYLSAFALVDHDKKIRIMAADSKPYEVGTQLPLSWILGKLKDCPVRNKLLVLDIMRSMLDPADVGGTADGVSDLIARELQDPGDSSRLNDPNLMVIAACGPGQITLGASTLQHSVFGYYFHRGLTTQEADGDGGGTITVRELAAYLTRNVDDWAVHHRGLHQNPVLLGRSRGDFPLAAVRVSRPTAEPTPAETADRPAEKGQSEPTAGPVARANEPAVPPKEEAKAKGAAADAGKSQPAAEEDGVYPAWLARSWAQVDQWRTTGDFRVAPRVYRRLARESTRAELRWRGGEPEESIRRDLDAAVFELTGAMKQAVNMPRPRARSVGQARDFGWQPDPTLTTSLTGLLRHRHELPNGSPDLAKSVKETLGKFKDRTALDLAGALVDAVEGENLDAATLAFLDGLVAESRTVLDPSHPPREIQELQFLHQLAQRAGKEPTTWKPETAQVAWWTVLAAEQAHSRPETMAWVRSALDTAAASLHEARVLLLPETAGCVSSQQIDKAWSDAQKNYQSVTIGQQMIQEGHAVLARALATLDGLVPYLEARPKSDLQPDWLDVAAQCDALAQMLRRPDQPAGDTGAPATLAEAYRRLDQRSRRLLLTFQPAAVRAIAERCETENPPQPELAAEIDAMLLTPFFSVAVRRQLDSAGRVLDRRLERAWRVSGAPQPPISPPDTRAGDRARRRAERITARLDLAGAVRTGRLLKEFRLAMEQASQGRSSSDPDLAWDIADAASLWAGIARGSELAHEAFEELIRSSNEGEGELLDRPGWLAPAYLTGFGDWSSAPIRRARERAALTTWAWLAGLYQYESYDLAGLMDPDGMLARAARECRDSADSSAREIALWIEGPASPIALSSRGAATTITLGMTLTGAEADHPQKVELRVLRREDSRLSVFAPEPAAPEVSSTVKTEVALGLKYTDDPSQTDAPPGGFLVLAGLPNGRTYHAIVPLSIVSIGAVPVLALSRDKARCDELATESIRLRPLAGLRQPFYVFVKNPTDRHQDVVVELAEGGNTIRAKPLPVAAHSSIVVPGFGTAEPKLGVELRAPAGPLRLRLRDASGELIDEQSLRSTIAAPRDYIEVTRAEFVPDAPGQPNRLTVRLRARPELAGPPCPVELVLPIDKDLFPMLRELPKAGKLVGELKPGQSELTLYAEGLVLDPGDKPGLFYLNVDGVERALWFRCVFPPIGGPQLAAPAAQPRVRLRAHPHVEPDKPEIPARLDVAFRVDDAPDDALLDVRLGPFTDGKIATDLAWTGPARRRHIGFDPGGQGGALLFEASIRDQVWNPLVPGLVGPRRLQARLLDGSGTELSSFVTDLILDDRIPSALSLQLPDRIARGNDLPVRASVTPPPSKIKDVAFIVGTKADFPKAEAQNRVVRGRSSDPDGSEWQGTLRVPADATAKLVVTARFTTGVGLTAFQSAEVAVIDPPRPGDMKPAPPRRGAISGTVREGDLTQRGLKVYLLDPMAPANTNPVVATAETDEKGAFSFKNLEPKAYRIYCIKQDGINNRKALDPIKVEPGKTLAHDLSLMK